MPRHKSPAPRLRILFGDAIAIGPGKADLLDAIAQTGSIAAGGRRLGMSYRRAWLLVETMNRSFNTPLVIAAKGGQRGGGAHLTPTGIDVLARYRAMEARAERALADDMATFSTLLKTRRSGR
jgi:molybdate transport system regulatory protein